MMRLGPMLALGLGLALGVAANTALAHGSGYGPGYGYGYGYGPGMGPGYGPHMGRGYGPHMGRGAYGPGPHYYGPGRMGPGYGRPYGSERMGPGYGRGMMGPYGQGMYGTRPMPERNLSTEEVRARLEHWLQMHGLTGLEVGNVSEQDEETITAEVIDGDGKVVQRYEFNRHTGAMRPSS